MNFKDNKPIYLQIADFICEQILLGHWTIDSKIPSVRDLAIQLEVNPNTVMRTYEFLQQKQLIQNKRGIGYFTTIDAINKAKEILKVAFIENELPLFFKNMYLLNLSFEEINSKYLNYINQNYPDKTNEN